MIASALLLAGLPPRSTVPGCLPRHEAAALRLVDFDSPAEIELPPVGVAPAGIAVLFAGSDVADKDGTIVDAAGTVVSQPLRQIADRLACGGYISIRYNKRYVSNATTVDRPRFDRLNGADLARDGLAAVAYVHGRPSLASLPIALIGLSQGTTVAMAVAAAEPAVRAVVLMAPVIQSPARNAQAQYLRVGKPYLQRFATANALDAAAIRRAGAASGGMLPQIFVGMFRGFVPGEQVNPLLDANRDDRISFREADPVIASWYVDGPGGGLGMDATGRALKGVADAFPAMSQPILILQGLNDGNVDVAATRAFAVGSEARRRVTLRTYAHLGHSLGPARSMFEDRLLPTARQPLDEIVGWLNQKIGKGASTRP